MLPIANPEMRPGGRVDDARISGSMPPEAPRDNDWRQLLLNRLELSGLTKLDE